MTTNTSRSLPRNLAILVTLSTAAWQCPSTVVRGNIQGPPVCGNAVTDMGEQCDDGNLTDGDGCSALCEVEPGCRTDLGAAEPFNVFLFHDLLGIPDVEGKVAARGLVNMSSFSIGFVDQGGTALVAGDLDLLNGQVYGDGFFSGAASTTGVTFVGGGLAPGAPIDFVAEEVNLKALSAWIDLMAPNGTTNVQVFGPINIVSFVGTDPDLNVFEIDGSVLAATKQLDITAPSTSQVIINVKGSAFTASSFSVFRHGVSTGNLLWNAYEAYNVGLSNIDWPGTLLAPFADVDFNNGQLNGQLVANNAFGTGEFHFDLYEGGFVCGPPPECRDGILDPGEECDDGNNVDGDGCESDCTLTHLDCPIDLGAAEPFNVFVFDDFLGSPDVEGKLAAGDDVDLDNFAIAFGDQGGQALVGGDIDLVNGSVYGDIVYSSSLGLSSVNLGAGGAEVMGSPIDFGAAETHLLTTSSYLASQPANGSTSITAITGGVIIDMVGTDPVTNIFELAGSDLSAARSVSITTPPGATAIVNVTGTDIMPNDFDFFYTGTNSSKVLYNLYQATTLDMTRLGWRGTILAPRAEVMFSNGQMDGQLIAYRATGTGEYHFVLFEGELCP